MKTIKNYKTLAMVFVGVILGITTNAQAGELTDGIVLNAANDTTEVYDVVDQMPEIVGGLPEIYKHIKYPSKAKNDRIEGRVFIRFIVDENGKVQSPQILKDIGGGCGQAAIEGIQKVKFKPGSKNGTPVKVYYSLPVNFKITF
tara:strand:+ start:181285 stop:181716 length:432 start_codon:yes stop_codon:yes gene_type:complete